MCGEVFVTEEKSLISFAIISTEWHEEKKIIWICLFHFAYSALRNREVVKQLLV